MSRAKPIVLRPVATLTAQAGTIEQQAAFDVDISFDDITVVQIYEATVSYVGWSAAQIAADIERSVRP